MNTHILYIYMYIFTFLCAYNCMNKIREYYLDEFSDVSICIFNFFVAGSLYQTRDLPFTGVPFFI